MHAATTRSLTAYKLQHATAANANTHVSPEPSVKEEQQQQQLQQPVDVIVSTAVTDNNCSVAERAQRRDTGDSRPVKLHAAANAVATAA